MEKEEGKSETKSEKQKKPDFVKWFSELNKESGKIAGGKGANLAEIYNLKIQVPPGFVVTAQAYDYFLEKAGIDEKIKKLYGKIKYEDTEHLNKVTKEIRETIEKSNFPKEMEEEIIESYETLGAGQHAKSMPAHDILKKTSEEFVAVRSSATTEDLAEASFAGQQDTYLNIKGKSELLDSIKKCFASLFTSRATYYRNKKGFKHDEASLAVIVQKMVDSKKSGVVFSKDPSTSKNNVIIESVWGLGEGIVSGKISPDRHTLSKDPDDPDELKTIKEEIGNKKIAITRDSSGKREVVKLKEEISKRKVLKNHEIKKLGEIAIKLEKHYKKPQDIEFAIENDEIYIVQTRPITTIQKGDTTRTGVGKELRGEVVLKGLAASPGIGAGKVRVVRELSDLGKIREGDILVTKMTNPDMVVTMQKSAAIVTDEGGLTAHASIVSREMGIPAIVGTQEATTKLKDGEMITVNGFTGKIYKGKVAETEKKEVKPIESETKTKIKVIIDLPSFAKRAAKSRAKAVGLARIEGIIAESGKHPNYFLEKDSMDDYEEVIFKGIKEIGKYFDDLWIRTSDIRSDEFRELKGSSKEKEANPMLGMHGIRYSLRKPKILKAELLAMKKLSDEGKRIGVLMPQIISVEEVKKVKEILKEIGFLKARVGVMIETPAAVQIIRELCDEGVDFISFGTNDLTQYTLAVDRGNRLVQNLYNELDPSILHQIEYVMKVCKEKGVETSICGQAGSKKEMVKFLVEQGIDSISTNADVSAEIAKYISKIEGGDDVEEEEEKTQLEKESERKDFYSDGQEEPPKENSGSGEEELIDRNEGNEKTAGKKPEGESEQKEKKEYGSDEQSGEGLEEKKVFKKGEKIGEDNEEKREGKPKDSGEESQKTEEAPEGGTENENNQEKIKESGDREFEQEESKHSKDEEEFPVIRGAQPPSGEESEDDIFDKELGVVDEIKENIEKGKEIIENAVENISHEKEGEKDEESGEEKESGSKDREREEVLDIF